MFKILITYICWKKYIRYNIWRVAVRPSYIQDAWFLKVKIPSTYICWKKYIKCNIWNVAVGRSYI
jgi:hypothetical protein